MIKKENFKDILLLIGRANIEGINATGLMVLILCRLGHSRPGHMTRLLRDRGVSTPFPTVSLQLRILESRGFVERLETPPESDQRASLWRITAAGSGLLEG